MNYDQIIEEILNYAKTQKVKNNLPNYTVNVNSLMDHFKRNYPDLDPRPIVDMIEEIDARGWFLESTSSVLVFDPATFS